jgi:hypothetical protein
MLQHFGTRRKHAWQSFRDLAFLLLAAVTWGLFVLNAAHQVKLMLILSRPSVTQAATSGRTTVTITTYAADRVRGESGD